MYNPGLPRRFIHDGVEVVAELDAAGGLQARYVRGDGPDELLVAYSDSSVNSRRWLHSDERGSVIVQTDSTGAAQAILRYDEFGVPAVTNGGLFQYTGQMWLGEIGVQYSRARMYAPHLGRFLQPDPIGYVDGMNLYAYVLNDPVNFTDPLGLQVVNCLGWLGCPSEWVVTGTRDGGPTGAGISGGGGGTILLPMFVSRSAEGGGSVGSRTREKRLPKCDAGQQFGQTVGKGLVVLGGAVGQIGYIGTASGVSIAYVGARRGNVPMAATGALIAQRFAPLSLGGMLMSAGGASLMAVSGSGKPAVVQLVAISSTSFIPPGFGRSTMKQIITNALNSVLPEIQACAP